MLTAEAFAEWLAEARMGEWVCYWRGPSVFMDYETGEKHPPASAAFRAHLAGLAILASRRIARGPGAGGFEFLALRVEREAVA